MCIAVSEIVTDALCMGRGGVMILPLSEIFLSAPYLFYSLTVDLRREDELRYSRTIVVPKGPMLRLLLPDSARIIGNIHLHSVRLNNIIV